MENIAEAVWTGTKETWAWLRGVLLGEWEDHQSLSQIVTNALSGFIFGVGSIITLRDLLAIIFRLAKYPEKRKEVNEWILLIAMLLPLILTVVGVVGAGVGALVGAEVGGFFRAVGLFLVKESGVGLKAMIDFFAGHGYGNALAALRAVKFAQFEKAAVTQFSQQVNRLLILLQKLESRLRGLHPESLPHWIPTRDQMVYALNQIPEWAAALKSLRQNALEMIPQALREMDRRLGALLAGDVKAATQATHHIATGTQAPAVGKLAAAHAAAEGEHAAANDAALLHNPHAPEPGNTRRIPERRVIALVGKREYTVVDEAGRPVGAKPYVDGVTRVEYPGLELESWDLHGASKVQQGWPDLAPKRDHANFNTLIPSRLKAGSKSNLQRVVDYDKTWMDGGPYYNRELPIDGEDLRANSAVKGEWNEDGQYVTLTVPPQGHPIWKDLHALQEKAAGTEVPYIEELKFWDGKASSQVYKIKLDDGTTISDDWYLIGGKEQQFFDRQQMALLKQHGFVSERKETGFSDFDGKNIIPKGGPILEVIPQHKAVPPPR